MTLRDVFLYALAIAAFVFLGLQAIPAHAGHSATFRVGLTIGPRPPGVSNDPISVYEAVPPKKKDKAPQYVKPDGTLVIDLQGKFWQ